METEKVYENSAILEASFNEMPSAYADRLGLAYGQKVSSEHKKNLGQFFTPQKIAKFLAGFISTKKRRIRILDPGCGTGILTCALAEHIANDLKSVREIELVAFESDVDIAPLAEKSFAYLRNWLDSKKINFNHFLCVNDFVLHNTTLLHNQPNKEETFDCIIANPPYFKISKSDPRAKAARPVIYGQTNIYSLFLILSAKLLSKNGQLVFISPRSFASGNYFRLFRTLFFSLVKIKSIHLFESRRDAFYRDNVLQENIIIYARKNSSIQDSKAKGKPNSSPVIVSRSAGVSDLDNRQLKIYQFHDLVKIKSYQKILHLPSSNLEERAIKIFNSWKESFESFGIEISTGPVVDFRSLKFISSQFLPGYVPLIWLNNVKPMEFIWPNNSKQKGKEKGQYILYSNESESRLIPNRNYVFLRRFSAKDDKSRLTACPYFRKWLPAFHFIGVENHLNYIYKKKGTLGRFEVLGIAALLNSKLFDVYFRTFNGNINVSATELREMPFPSFETVEQIGRLISRANFSRNIIDVAIESIFKSSLDIND